MSCFQPIKLADYSSGELSKSERSSIESHLASCSACRKAYARISNAQLALREISESAPPPLTPAHSARIEAALRWTRPKAAPSSNRSISNWWWGVAATTATAAAAVVLAIRYTPSDGPSEARKPIATAPARARENVAPAPASRSTSEAITTLVGGKATVHRGGATIPLHPLARLNVGDRIVTEEGGRVGLQWADASGALISGASDVTLAKLTPTTQDLALHKGQIAVRVGTRQPGEVLRVLTTDHAVTVHGTWFVVSSASGGTTVEVLEGVVEVAPRDGDGSSTKMVAPQRAHFSSGRGLAGDIRDLAGREASALRAASEMGLLGGWGDLDRLAESTGSIRIESETPANLVIDGVAFGTAPLEIRRPRGRHLVELSRSGYGTFTKWVSVGSETAELRTALLPERNSREAQTVPPTAEEMREVRVAHQRKVSACYEHRLKQEPTLSGSINLELRINGKGRVASSTVQSATLTDPEVASCLRREASSWTFPTARNATVIYPFVFRAN